MFKHILTVVLVSVGIAISPVAYADDISREDYEFMMDYNRFNDEGTIKHLNGIQVEFAAQISTVLTNSTIKHSQFNALYAYVKALLGTYQEAFDRLRRSPVMTPGMNKIKQAALSLYAPYQGYYDYFVYGLVRQNTTIIYTAVERIRGLEAQHQLFDGMYQKAGDEAGKIQAGILEKFGSFAKAKQFFDDEAEKAMLKPHADALNTATKNDEDDEDDDEDEDEGGDND